jgi:hypothetical protein
MSRLLNDGELGENIRGWCECVSNLWRGRPQPKLAKRAYYHYHHQGSQGFPKQGGWIKATCVCKSGLICKRSATRRAGCRVRCQDKSSWPVSTRTYSLFSPYCCGSKLGRLELFLRWSKVRSADLDDILPILKTFSYYQCPIQETLLNIQHNTQHYNYNCNNNTNNTNNEHAYAGRSTE